MNNNKELLPVDYLNEIAPKAPKKINLLIGQPIIIIATAVILLIVIILIATNLLSTNKQSMQKLAARLITTNSIAEDASSNLKNTKLRATNGNLKIYLTNTIRDIEPILTSENVKIKSLDKNITASEISQNTIDTLEDARLNAIYDRTYAREMAYKLDTVLTLIDQINDATNNKTIKEFLNNSYVNLVPIQKELADFNEVD
ncbi:MAG: hypothetical protein PWQ10_355 [Patescibacteria group bacterium]|nr:hypothetical protein [Patescibacteria group bacterium]